MGIRPTSTAIIRDGKRIPLELTPMAGDFDDGYEHWSALPTRLEQDDQMEIADLKPGLVVHFANGHLVRVKLWTYPDIAVFRTEPVE